MKKYFENDYVLTNFENLATNFFLNCGNLEMLLDTLSHFISQKYFEVLEFIVLFILNRLSRCIAKPLYDTDTHGADDVRFYCTRIYNLQIVEY